MRTIPPWMKDESYTGNARALADFALDGTRKCRLVASASLAEFFPIRREATSPEATPRCLC
jgi:hypothetical protein